MPNKTTSHHQLAKNLAISTRKKNKEIRELKAENDRLKGIIANDCPYYTYHQMEQDAHDITKAELVDCKRKIKNQRKELRALGNEYGNMTKCAVRMSRKIFDIRNWLNHISYIDSDDADELSNLLKFKGQK